MPEEVHHHREQLEGRSILVNEAEVIPLEAIVRGYITGENSVNQVKSTPRPVSLSFSRLCVGRVQKVSYGAWHPAARGPARIREISPPRSLPPPQRQNRERMTRTSPGPETVVLYMPPPDLSNHRFPLSPERILRPSQTDRARLYERGGRPRDAGEVFECERQIIEVVKGRNQHARAKGWMYRKCRMRWITAAIYWTECV